MASGDNIGALIIAGGNADRMGYPKPWLTDHRGVTFAERLISAYYEFGCSEIILVLNKAFCSPPWLEHIDHLESRAKIIENDHPEKGKIFSMQLGTGKLLTQEFVFIQNIDNPFTNPGHLKLLSDHKCSEGYTVPTYLHKGGHPIIVSNKIISEIHRVKNYSLHFKKILGQFEKRELEVGDNTILVNINTPEAYFEHFHIDINTLRVK